MIKVTKIILIGLAILVLLPPAVEARGRRLGLGVMLGNPTGISSNYRLKKRRSFDGALAFGSDSELYLHGTYLFRHPRSITLEKYKFGWYYGLGLRLHSKKKGGKKKGEQENFLVPRAALGWSFPFQKNKFEIFTEIAMVLDILPETNVNLKFALGGRFYF